MTDDEHGNLKMDLVISVDSNDTVSGKQYYKVTLFGSLDRKLQDIQVIDVKKCDKSDVCDDNLLSQFILPDIREEDLERIGNELFSYYSIFADMQGYGLSLCKIIDNMNAPIFYADLPDDCLGRINLVETEIKTYRYDIDTQQLYEVCGHAKPGVILLNKKRYYDGLDGELLLTVAHELVHWQLHQKFFKLLVVLGADSDAMNCKELPEIFSDSMTDIEKALCIAEWQANSLAMRLAIPKSTVDTAIEVIANNPSTHYKNAGDRMQACVIQFAKMYGVSAYVAKSRLRQLGYDFVDGTILEYEYNGNKIKPAPFYFQPGTLKGNETFVIDRNNYEMLLRENKDFSELITSHICIYTGYVVCLYDAKYIRPAVNNGKISYELTDYAREHADECCLFYTLSSSHIINNYIFYGQKYLCNVTGSIKAEYSYDENGQLIISRGVKNVIDRRKRDAEIYDKIIKHGMMTFSSALKYIMTEANLTKESVAERIGCDPRTIQNYRNSQTPDSIEKVLLFCLGCQTGPKVSNFLIEKSVGGIPDIGMKKTAYEFLLENTNATLEIWNKILNDFELPPIYM